MRLCYISNPNSPHTRRWVDWFVKHGHTVCLLADVPAQQPWPEMTLVDLSKKFYAPIIRFPIWTVWLRRFLRQWQPDILHAHRVNSAGWLAAFSGFHPLVVTPWGTDLYQLPNGSLLARWLAEIVLKRADLITADAQDLLQTAENHGADPAHLHLIKWGVDLDHYHPGPKNPILLSTLSIGEGPVILSPRGVNPIYNLELIIQAVAALRSFFPQIVLILRDYNTQASYKKQLERLIKQLDLIQSVRWVGRIEPWERVADIYRLADVVVSVPDSDSTPVSLLEAFACGIPVIASDLPALREWITPGESGILVPAHDVSRLTSELKKVLTNNALAERFRKSGKNLVEVHANHDIEMKKMEILYQSLLNK